MYITYSTFTIEEKKNKEKKKYINYKGKKNFFFII